VCAKCDTRFNQFWDWAPICPNCKHGSQKCVNGVTEASVRQHTTTQQERRVQTECLHRPLDTVLMAVSGNFVSGTATGPLSYASQWLRTAKVQAYARYEDMANASGETSFDCPEYSRDRHKELSDQSMPHMEVNTGTQTDSFQPQPRHETYCDSDCEGCDQCADKWIDRYEREVARNAPIPVYLLDLPFAVVPPPTCAVCDPVTTTPPTTRLPKTIATAPPRDWVAEAVIIGAALALVAGLMDLVATCSGAGVDALSFPPTANDDSDSPMQMSSCLFWGYAWLVLNMIVVETLRAVQLFASGRRMTWTNSCSRALLRRFRAAFSPAKVEACMCCSRHLWRLHVELERRTHA
jgi:hypothetical protein